MILEVLKLTEKAAFCVEKLVETDKNGLELELDGSAGYVRADVAKLEVGTRLEFDQLCVQGVRQSPDAVTQNGEPVTWLLLGKV